MFKFEFSTKIASQQGQGLLEEEDIRVGAKVCDQD